MPKKQDKRIEAASESLEQMLRRIGPFMPKHPKIKPPETKNWESTTEGVIPWPPCDCPTKPKNRSGQGTTEIF